MYFDFYSRTGNGNVLPRSGATDRRYLTAALFNGARYIFHMDPRAMSTAKNVQTERNETIVYNDCGIANRGRR